MLYREVVEQTNAMVVSAGMARAQGETTLLGRLSAFFATPCRPTAEDRSAAAFLVTSVLESQRHPELSNEEHDSLKNSREFMSWAVNDAIQNGRADHRHRRPTLVEMLVAVMWGMGFYAGYVGTHDELESVVHKFELLLANKLWQLASSRIWQSAVVTWGDVAHIACSLAKLLGSIAYEMTDLMKCGSIRTEGDSWDITESVGATALGVAAARAVETARTTR